MFNKSQQKQTYIKNKMVVINLPFDFVNLAGQQRLQFTKNQSFLLI